MFLGNSFGKTLDILHRTMDVANYRRNVIANNLANATTPEYKRSVVNFESMLKYALSTEKPSRFQTAVTDEKHIPFNRQMDYREVRPRRVLDFTRTAKNNGNNVDLEEEAANSLHNQLRYEIMAYTVTNQFTRVNSVLRSV